MPRNEKNADKQSLSGTVLSVELEDYGEDVNIGVTRNKLPLEDPWMRDMISGSLAEVMVRDELVGKTICNAFGQFLDLTLGREASDAVIVAMSRVMDKYAQAEKVAGKLFNFKSKRYK